MNTNVQVHLVGKRTEQACSCLVLPFAALGRVVAERCWDGFVCVQAMCCMPGTAQGVMQGEHNVNCCKGKPVGERRAGETTAACKLTFRCLLIYGTLDS